MKYILIALSLIPTPSAAKFERIYEQVSGSWECVDGNRELSDLGDMNRILDITFRDDREFHSSFRASRNTQKGLEVFVGTLGGEWRIQDAALVVRPSFIELSGFIVDGTDYADHEEIATMLKEANKKMEDVAVGRGIGFVLDSLTAESMVSMNPHDPSERVVCTRR